MFPLRFMFTIFVSFNLIGSYESGDLFYKKPSHLMLETFKTN